MSKGTQTATPQEEHFDLNALLGLFVDRKWLILGITLVFLIIGVCYSIFGRPIYQANAMLQVEQKVPDLPGLSVITQTLGASDSEDATEMAIITSRSVVGQAVDHLNLNIVIAPHYFPLIGNFLARSYEQDNPGSLAKAKLGISRYDWGGARLNINRLELPDALYAKDLTLVARENGEFDLLDDDNNLLVRGAVGRPAEARGVLIHVQSMLANPGMRFKVVRNRELTTISKLQQTINVSEQGKDSGIIGLTYSNADPFLAAAVLNEVGQAYVRQNVERNSEEASNSLRFVKDQLPIVRESLERAQASLNAYQEKSHSAVDLSLQTKGLLDQLVAVETSIQQLQLQQADIERRYTKDHPAYQSLLKQIGQLQSQKSGIEKQVNGLPDTQRDMLRLAGDVKVEDATYNTLLNQAQQLEIARAGTVGNVRVIDTAAVDVTNPIWPKALLIIPGGTVLGMFLAVAYLLIRQMLNRGIEDPSDIAHLGLPVYASIPLSNQERAITVRSPGRHGDGKQHLLAVTAPADLAIEALRSLRTSLHFAQLESKNNLLMISGSSPNAGKTFVSSNLAAVIAHAGQKVVLVDADMRKGGQHKVLGGNAENGLSELISGLLPLDEAIRPVNGVDKLHFIARGKVPPNPSELLMHANFTALLHELMSRYELVIIDTPPILAVTDAAVIGHHAGTNLLVVRFGLNQVREIDLAKQRFEQNGVEVRGAIFNAVQKRSAGYYSYGYYEYK